MTQTEKQIYTNTPYLSSPAGLFRRVQDANNLEPIVTNGVSQWFSQRMIRDFTESGNVKPQADNVDRWMAHLLLTTTVNITTALDDPMVENQCLPPSDFFIDLEALSKIGMLVSSTVFIFLGQCLMRKLNRNIYVAFFASKTFVQDHRLLGYRQ